MISALLTSQYLTAGLTLVIICVFVRTLRQKRHRLPPGPTGWPILGNYLTLVTSKLEQHELMDKWADEYGDIFMFSMFGTPFIVLNSYALLQEAFHSPDINDRAPILPCNKALKRPNTGNGLISRNEGPLWKEQRKFLLSVLREFKVSNHHFEDLVAAETSKLFKKISEHKGAFFDPVDYVFVTVSNVSTKIIMGKSYEHDDRELIRLTELARGVFDWMGPGSFLYHVPLLAHMPMEINRKGDKVVKELMDFIEVVISQHRQSFDPSQEPKCVIDSFLKEQSTRSSKGVNPGSFDDQCLKQLTFDLIIGGFETVSTSLTWYFLFMAQYPEVQAKVQAELDRVVGRDRLPSLSDRRQLPYTAAAIAECYRFSGVLPVQIPKRTRCDVKLDGYDIPKGAYVATNAHWLSSSPRLWKNSDEFKPERFLTNGDGEFDSNLEATLAEFGFGRRICPGEELARTELFIIFSHVLHRYNIELPKGTPISRAGVSRLTVHPLPYKLRALPRA